MAGRAVGLAAGGGVALLATGAGRHLDPAGLALAMLAGTFWAAYILLNKETGRRFDSLNGLAWAMTAGGLALLPFGVLSAGAALFRPAVLGLGAVVAILASVIPYSLELPALRRVTPRAFGVMMSLDPALATAAGFLVLGQHLTLQEWAALALVVGANVGNTLAGRPGAVARRLRSPEHAEVGRPGTALAYPCQPSGGWTGKPGPGSFEKGGKSWAKAQTPGGPGDAGPVTWARDGRPRPSWLGPRPSRIRRDAAFEGGALSADHGPRRRRGRRGRGDHRQGTAQRRAEPLPERLQHPALGFGRGCCMALEERSHRARAGLEDRRRGRGDPEARRVSPALPRAGSTAIRFFPARPSWRPNCSSTTATASASSPSSWRSTFPPGRSRTPRPTPPPG